MIDDEPVDLGLGNHLVGSEAIPVEQEDDEQLDVEQADKEYLARLIDAAEWGG
jgi:hypothetical protein